MKPCPRCAFLLPPEATTCQFCKSPQVDALTHADVPQAAFVGAPPAASGAAPAVTTGGFSATGPGAWDRRYRDNANSSWAVHYPPGTAADAPSTRVVKYVCLGLGLVGLAVGIVMLAGLLIGTKPGAGGATAPWTAYTAPDLTFTAEGPGAPVTKSIPFQLADGTPVEEKVYAFSTGEHSSVVVDVTPLVLGSNPALADVFNKTIDKMKNDGLVLVSQGTSAFGSEPSMVFTGTDGTTGATVRGEVLIHVGRVFILTSHESPGEGSAAHAAFERLRASFQPGG